MKAVYMNDNKDYVREFLYGTSDSNLIGKDNVIHLYG